MTLISCIIPTINEVDNIEPTIFKIHKSMSLVHSGIYEIIFVDNNSSDGTKTKILSQKEVILINSDLRKGLGYDLILASNKAKGKFICFLDCDMSIDYLDLVKILKAIHEKTVVIGSRYIPGSVINGSTLVKKIGSFLLNYIIKIIYNINAIDLSHSLRVFPNFDLNKIQDYKHPAFFWSLSRYHNKLGYTFKEIPITFNERIMGDSKNHLFDLLKTSFKYLITR